MRVRLIAPPLGLLLAIFACSHDDAVARATLAEGCSINSDCEAPLACAFSECHDVCTASRDCPNGELCVASDKPFHVCQLPSEENCTTSGQCAGTQICGIDQHCRDACAADLDCLPNQYCAGGTCADVGSPPIPVVLEAGAGDAAIPTGQPCQYNHDCTQPLVCSQRAMRARVHRRHRLRARRSLLPELQGASRRRR